MVAQTVRVSVLFQRRDARQGLALHPLEEGAARGGDIGEALRRARTVERGHRVAAACDRDELAVGAALRGMFGGGFGSSVERRDLEGTERAVPDQRLCPVDSFP